MSNITELKEYLIGTKNPYLLDESNNGKTIMFSGLWGAGKTHFWINEIQPKLLSSIKNKACVYVSLYGKNDIETIKNEILLKAYAGLSKKDNKIQKRAIAAFGIGSKILSSASYMGAKIDSKNISDAITNFFEDKEMNKAIEYISDGGVICLDDFERKSNKIDLNDLFGFISQLSIEMNCKVVVILNSDVFTGEEANVFKTVKEKTISKYFNFSPSIEELFKSIFSSDEKYKIINQHKKIIFNSIMETNELNARIYIQVLDNCLEWIKKGYDENALRALTLCTINFTKNHFAFETITLQGGHETDKILERFLDNIELGTYIKRPLHEVPFFELV